MRKAISSSVTLFLLFVVMLCSAGYAIAEGNSVQPLYDLARTCNAMITISEDGTARCSGYIRAINSTDSISANLRYIEKLEHHGFSLDVGQQATSSITSSSTKPVMLHRVLTRFN